MNIADALFDLQSGNYDEARDACVGFSEAQIIDAARDEGYSDKAAKNAAKFLTHELTLDQYKRL